mmetsp:Transcript_57284/g.79475  ORF Transcript_57284/g.79475 Transcript_57284/m.79475 type:complete len:226 (-) Transcript_57284:519-1196(-)
MCDSPSLHSHRTTLWPRSPGPRKTCVRRSAASAATAATAARPHPSPWRRLLSESFLSSRRACATSASAPKGSAKRLSRSSPRSVRSRKLDPGPRSSRCADGGASKSMRAPSAKSSRTSRRSPHRKTVRHAPPSSSSASCSHARARASFGPCGHGLLLPGLVQPGSPVPATLSELFWRSHNEASSTRAISRQAKGESPGSRGGSRSTQKTSGNCHSRFEDALIFQK